ncbi:MAG: Sec-independent protein translocase protein TatB [Pseudomonadota bacterium]|nr:Sec-independent protein translocase protein TatB [Pseudomonadota bacterium]
MFDIGFLEILIVLIIALLVIGPERMPEVARKLGSFMGKTKRFIASVKEEGHLQETVDELKKSMDLQEEQKTIQNLEQNLHESMNQSAQEIDLEEFNRPTFGGKAQAIENSGGSQFSKAPAQPVIPTAETAAESSATEQPAPVQAETPPVQPEPVENKITETEPVASKSETKV